ncbi:MAG TPA: hypothetical protein VLA52_02150 [Thermohalobaculum sp.]|nr:hypothetical protein [Thermohalobaculum sp.]
MQAANLPDGPNVLKLDTAVAVLPRDRVLRAKAAYTTRRMELGAAVRLVTGNIAPKSGDLVLARIQRIGQHGRIELASGRRATLSIGDEIIVAYGARYAPDQFEAHVPSDLGPCDLVAAGGLASECTEKHGRMKSPTRIEPVGLLAYADGAVMNMIDGAFLKAEPHQRRPKVFAVFGTMMNAGKTTCAAKLVQGLKRRRLRVGAAKVTGTGAGGDRWMMLDAGADQVLDFTDAGVPSTFELPVEQVEEIFTDIVDHLAAGGADAIVLEVADGLCQRETAALLRSDVFRARCDGIVFAAGDALGAQAGVQHVQALGHSVIAAGGAMTASPLAIREAMQLLDVPIVTSSDLSSGRWLPLGEDEPGADDQAVIDLPLEKTKASADRPLKDFASWIDVNGPSMTKKG